MEKLDNFRVSLHARFHQRSGLSPGLYATGMIVERERFLSVQLRHKSRHERSCSELA